MYGRLAKAQCVAQDPIRPPRRARSGYRRRERRRAADDAGVVGDRPIGGCSGVCRAPAYAAAGRRRSPACWRPGLARQGSAAGVVITGAALGGRAVQVGGARRPDTTVHKRSGPASCLEFAVCAPVRAAAVPRGIRKSGCSLMKPPNRTAGSTAGTARLTHRADGRPSTASDRRARGASRSGVGPRRQMVQPEARCRRRREACRGLDHARTPQGRARPSGPAGTADGNEPGAPGAIATTTGRAGWALTCRMQGQLTSPVSSVRRGLVVRQC